MKKIIALIIFGVGIAGNSYAQGLIDSGIRARSAELERIKRQAEKNGVIELGNGVTIDAVMFKKNFEGIQKLQDSIVEAYTKGKKIDYKKINKLSGKMNAIALKLEADLFSLAEKKSVETTQPLAEGKNIRDLIIELDKAIWQFVSSPLFQDINAVDRAVSEKALSELQEIIRLSRSLEIETESIREK